VGGGEGLPRSGSKTLNNLQPSRHSLRARPGEGVEQHQQRGRKMEEGIGKVTEVMKIEPPNPTKGNT